MAGQEPLSQDDFLWAVKNGTLDEIKHALSKQGELANKKIGPRYPIHYAADYNQVDVVKLLIQHGADVNVEDSYNITPLLSAVYEGHEATVEVLLSKGADKHKKSPDGKTMVECADTETMKKLLK